MPARRIYQYAITASLVICLQVGCSNSGDSVVCTAMWCDDAITVKLLPADNYLAGQYSVELLFSDNESIIAEFELTPVDEDDNTSDLMLKVIENESYFTSWFMFDEFQDPLEIHYSGTLLSGDLYIDYEFTEDVTVNVERDGILLLSEQISPNYNYYWCNGEKCDHRQNKEADIEIPIN